MIRDRIFSHNYGDTRVSTDDLTLEKAIEIRRAAEATRDRMQFISVVKSTSTDHSVQHDHSKFGRNRHRSTSRTAVNNDGDKCGNCGQQHEPKQCPAYDQKCSNCRRRGCFARCCRKLNRRQRSSSRSHTTSSTFNPTRSVNLLEDGVEILFVAELCQSTVYYRNVLCSVTLLLTTHQ